MEEVIGSTPIFSTYSTALIKFRAVFFMYNVQEAIRREKEIKKGRAGNIVEMSRATLFYFTG
jgi:hypothetical protein